jgi:hypothetical protein
MAIKEHYARLLKQLAQMAADGTLGPAIQATSVEYASYSDGIALALKYLYDYFAASEEDSTFARNYFVQILIVVYREAKKRDPEIAMDFLTAFITDYPGTNGTALLPRWTALGEAVLENKKTGNLGDRLSTWQASSRTVLCLNEFLDCLLGLLLVTWRYGLGRPSSHRVLENAYGSKVHAVNDLTNGDDGVFCLFLRLANPDLRNSLAHSTAWPDFDAGVVRFTSGRQNEVQKELGMVEFMLQTKVAADLAQGYIAALNAILVFETGDDAAIALIPQHLHRAWGI